MEVFSFIINLIFSVIHTAPFIILALILLTIWFFIRQGKVRVAYLVLFLSLALYSWQFGILLRDITYERNCFKFNKSYPGMPEYEKCVTILGSREYWNTLIFLIKK